MSAESPENDKQTDRSVKQCSVPPLTHSSGSSSRSINHTSEQPDVATPTVSALQHAFGPFADPSREFQPQLVMPPPAPTCSSAASTASSLRPSHEDYRYLAWKNFISAVTSSRNSTLQDKPVTPESESNGVISVKNDMSVTVGRMQMLLARALLLRCQVLQSLASVARPDSTKGDRKDPREDFYSEMYEQAKKANEHATELKNKALQSRCQYWEGRGMLGTKDYFAAQRHFDCAVKLGSPYWEGNNGQKQDGGMTQAEINDIKMLQENVEIGINKWLEDNPGFKMQAEDRAAQNGQPLEDCVNRAEWH